MLYHDLLIFSCDGYDVAFVVALDKHTGKVRWKTPRRQPISQAYSTPLVIRVGNRDEVVTLPRVCPPVATDINFAVSALIDDAKHDITASG